MTLHSCERDCSLSVANLCSRAFQYSISDGRPSAPSGTRCGAIGRSPISASAVAHHWRTASS